MSRIVLHLDMDAFFAAIEERDNPRFRGLPIVVGASPNGGLGRGVVSTANYEARKHGIHSAMPISWAYKACPTAIFLPVDMTRYVAVSKQIMGIAQKYAGKMEQVSVDEAYIEISNKLEVISNNYEEAERIAKEIKREIWEKEKLTCSIGIGPNKLIAKIASDCKKPDGLTLVQLNEVQKFLDPMSVRVIPGIGPKTEKALGDWDIGLVRDLRKIDKQKLVDKFGVHGEHLWNLAHGIDERPIEEDREVKSVGRQTTFEKDIKQAGPIIKTVFALLEEVFDELRQESLSGKTLTVIVRYAWFETHTSQKKLDHSLSLREAKKLALKLLLPYLTGKAVRLVGVRISGF
ncbi:MAG: DNA polymerase IV [bacterium]|nr:DNA polymerase IV [bacterium]